MDRSATLQSSTLLENPTVPAAYRLRDPGGNILNPYEKHMAEGIEMLSRFVDRNDAVLDFCAGTCSLGLAALYMNQRFVVLNDRDENQLKFAEAHLRAYLWAMSVSPLWRDDDMGSASPYKNPGVEVHELWDGRDPYLPLLAALQMEQVFDKIIVERHNMPGMKMEKMAELYYCEVDQEHGGVFLTESQHADFCFPIYGVYKRSPGNMEANQITSVLLRPMAGERKPYYMRVSDQCPWRYVRAPRDGEVANCVIRENQCGMHDLAKVVLALTEPINMREGPVELLCVYDLKKLSDGWKQANVPRSAKRRHDGMKLKGTTGQRKKKRKPTQSSASATASEEEDQEDAEEDDVAEQDEEELEDASQEDDVDDEDYK